MKNAYGKQRETKFDVISLYGLHPNPLCYDEKLEFLLGGYAFREKLTI